MGTVYEKYIFEDGSTFDVPADKETYRTKLLETFPADHIAINRYFELIRKASDQGTLVFAKRALPKAIGALIPKRLYSFWDRTTSSVLDEITKNEKLKRVLTGQWGYSASPPSESSFGIHSGIVSHYFKGGFYPVGSAESFADKLISNFKKHGGEFALRTEVKNILIENGDAQGIEMATGKTIRATRVISSIGAKKTLELLPKNTNNIKWQKRINELKDSPAYFCLYIGYECEDVEALGLSRANHWFFEDTLDTTWSDVSQAPPVMYLSFPSLKDPQHTGSHHTAELVTFTDYSLFEKWKETRRGKRTPDYMEFKKTFEAELLAIFKKRFPMLADKITLAELATPLSMEFFTKSHHGAIYGLASTVDRYLTKDLHAKTPIKGLYLTGQDVLTPGVVGAMSAGLLTAAAIDARVFRYL